MICEFFMLLSKPHKKVISFFYFFFFFALAQWFQTPHVICLEIICQAAPQEVTFAHENQNFTLMGLSEEFTVFSLLYGFVESNLISSHDVVSDSSCLQEQE